MVISLLSLGHLLKATLKLYCEMYWGENEKNAIYLPKQSVSQIYTHANI